MDTQTSKKDCTCDISNHSANCKGTHAENLSEAARYMLNKGGDIEMPRRVRVPSRRRSDDDGEVGYNDPPLPPRNNSRNAYYRESLSEELEEYNSYKANRTRICNSSEDDEIVSLPLRDSVGRPYRHPGGNLVEDSRLRAINREPMTKFESLKIGDKTVHEFTIGGYHVDLEKAAMKAQEVIHLPPAKLPIIFVDSHLNFLHHFFNGIYEVISHDDLMDVIRSEPGSTSNDFVIQTIDDLLTAGYERSDSEALNLIKRMLQSTFTTTTHRNRKSSEKVMSLYVEANLWGFPYIESTMTCKEIDMRYWLQACYKEYENDWFNTFKSTRVPNFARKVQTRSSQSSSSSKPSMSSIMEESSIESIADMIRDDTSVTSKPRTVRHGSRRRHRTSSGNSLSIDQWFRT